MDKDSDFKDVDGLDLKNVDGSYLNKFFDAYPLPTVVIEQNQGILYANSALMRLLGYGPNDHISDFSCLTHANDQLFNRCLHHVLTSAANDLIKVETSYLHKDGFSVYTTFSVVDIFLTDNKKIIVGYVSNSKKRIDLDPNQVMLNTLMKYSDDAIYIVDPNTAHFLSCNKNAYQRLQYTSEEILTMSVFDINARVNNPDSWATMIRQLRTKGQLLFESAHRRKDGTIMPVEVNITVASHNNEEYFVAIVRDISARKSKEQDSWREANLDPLTNLPNRRIFYNDLSIAAKKTKNKHKLVTLMYLDLDGFKALNDSLGHAAGDEFIIALAEIENKSMASMMVEKVALAFSEPFKLKGQLVKINASIGVIIFTVNQLDCSIEINLADKAMYRAKASNGVSVVYYKPERRITI